MTFIHSKFSEQKREVIRLRVSGLKPALPSAHQHDHDVGEAEEPQDEEEPED